MHRARFLPMSSLLDRRTPAQLLWILGSFHALVMVGFGVLSVHSWRFPNGPYLSHGYLFLCFVVSMTGFIGVLIVMSSLKRGVKAERWPDGMLESPRKLLSSSAFSVLSRLLFAGGLVSMILWLRSVHGDNGWLFLWPLTNLKDVQRCLRPKSDPFDHSLRIERGKALRSEHWGETPESFSN